MLLLLLLLLLLPLLLLLLLLLPLLLQLLLLLLDLLLLPLPPPPLLLLLLLLLLPLPVWNSGISFGFFQDSGEIGRYGFTIFAFLVSIWLIFSSFRMPRYSSLGFILIASGA